MVDPLQVVRTSRLYEVLIHIECRSDVALIQNTAQMGELCFFQGIIGSLMGECGTSGGQIAVAYAKLAAEGPVASLGAHVRTSKTHPLSCGMTGYTACFHCSCF